MTLVRARLEFLDKNWWCQVPGRDRRTSHVLLEAGRVEDKDQVDIVLPDILEAHPRLSGKEHSAARRYVIFLVIQRDVLGACLNQENLALAEMPVLGDHPLGRYVLCAKHEMLRPIYRVTLTNELVGRNRQRAAPTAYGLVSLVLLDDDSPVAP